MWRTEARVALRGRVEPRAGCQQEDIMLFYLLVRSR